MEDLEKAIHMSQGAVEKTLEDHSRRIKPLNTAAVALSMEHFLTHDKTALEKSRQFYITALDLTITDAGQRIAAGRDFLGVLSMLKEWKGQTLIGNIDVEDSQAYTIARKTVGLMPLLTPQYLSNTDQRYRLSQSVGISSDAAAIALHTNQGALAAIECLEIGRGIIGGGRLQQRDISALAKSHPELAISFLALRDQLNAPLEGRGTLNSRDIEADQRRDAEHQLSCLLEEIRLVKRFERFLLLASEKEMHDAAEQGPIVIINISIRRCDALIIEQSGFRSLQLSRISKKLVDKYSQNPGSIDTLEWLWDDIMAPIIGSLGFTSCSSDDGLPRVWWIPTGKLAKFPIHVAGHHLSRSGETALDTVVSSYASSVKAVIHNRGMMYQHQAKTERLSLVTVAMQDTEGLHTLQDAASEINAVVAALAEACDIFHFAGHGITNPVELLQSSLLLENWKEEPLTVADLLEADFNTRAPFQAYLSACGTSRIQDEKSLDESIHLVNACQLAGFRHVIGTLWNVNDRLCVEMAQKTYQFIQNRDIKNNDARVSRGLHQATLDLRNQWLDADKTLPTESSRGAKLDDARKMMRPLWVPYVHFGA